MSIRSGIGVLLVTLSVPACAVAATVSLGAGRDAVLCEDAAGALGNGAGQHLFTGRNNEPSIRRTLIRFDLAGAIPAGSTIDSVTLTLHLSRAAGDPSDVEVRRVLADWTEGVSDPDGSEGRCTLAAPGDATWLHASFDGLPWSVAGGDLAATAAAVRFVDLLGFHAWSSPDMVADVQSWLDGPGGNHGWALLGDESIGGTAKRFDSRGNPDPSLRPELLIDYTPPAAPTVWESTDPAVFGMEIGTAPASPFEHAPPPGEPMLFYRVDDGTGRPPVIFVVAGGPGIRILF